MLCIWRESSRSGACVQLAMAHFVAAQITRFANSHAVCYEPMHWTGHQMVRTNARVDRFGRRPLPTLFRATGLKMSCVSAAKFKALQVWFLFVLQSSGLIYCRPHYGRLARNGLPVWRADLLWKNRLRMFEAEGRILLGCWKMCRFYSYHDAMSGLTRIAAFQWHGWTALSICRKVRCCCAPVGGFEQLQKTWPIASPLAVCGRTPRADMRIREYLLCLYWDWAIRFGRCAWADAILSMRLGTDARRHQLWVLQSRD